LRYPPVWAIIAAGGRGRRVGNEIPKQFHQIDGRTILEYSTLPFLSLHYITGVVIVIPEDFLGFALEKFKVWSAKKGIKFITGGRERHLSVFNGLKAVPSKIKYVLIHDGVRPFITTDLINRVVEKMLLTGAAVPGILPKDTVKVINKRRVDETLGRNSLRLIQTPQGFRRDLIIRAYENALNNGMMGSDDAFFIETLGHRVFIVDGDETNIKITNPFDLMIAERLLNSARFVKA